MALVVVAIVVADDALDPTVYRHHRSLAVYALAGVVAAALLTLAPRIRSIPVALGAGIAAGGALATLVSAIAWGGVPDPLVRGGVAFNLADLSIAAGDALLVVAVLAHAWANRDRLRAPG
ncbi:MAG: hypothetical protein QOF43_2515 [Gaiellaceae bacterium]|nr:hypothetical protein [Gaiellaceae bacterium]